MTRSHFRNYPRELKDSRSFPTTNISPETSSLPLLKVFPPPSDPVSWNSHRSQIASLLWTHHRGLEMSTDLSKTRPNSSFAMSEVTDDCNHDNDDCNIIMIMINSHHTVALFSSFDRFGPKYRGLSFLDPQLRSSLMLILQWLIRGHYWRSGVWNTR